MISIEYLCLAIIASDSTSAQKHELLRLALSWNRADIAANVIMNNDSDWDVRVATAERISFQKSPFSYS